MIRQLFSLSLTEGATSKDLKMLRHFAAVVFHDTKFKTPNLKPCTKLQVLNLMNITKIFWTLNSQIYILIANANLILF